MGGLSLSSDHGKHRRKRSCGFCGTCWYPTPRFLAKGGRKSLRNLSVFVLLAELMGGAGGGDSLGGQPNQALLVGMCIFPPLPTSHDSPRPGGMYSLLSQKNTTPCRCTHPNLHFPGPTCLWTLCVQATKTLHPMCTTHSTELLRGTDSTCHILFQGD